MIDELKISKKDVDLISSDFETNKPYESCGVMIGTEYGNAINIDKIIPITNIRRTAVSFELDPIQLYGAWDDAQSNGKEIVGVYHTHPNHRAFPSSWDRQTMENMSLIWLIAGIDGMMAYVLDDDIRKLKLKIIEDGD